jgi:hypothetical protein
VKKIGASKERTQEYRQTNKEQISEKNPIEFVKVGNEKASEESCEKDCHVY